MFTFPEKIPCILKSANLQEELETKGYTILRLLDTVDIEKLITLYESSTDGKNGFYPTTYSKNTELRRNLSHEIIQLVSEKISGHFEHYKIFAGNFIVKFADKKSELGVHQDMTLVDESKYMGINIWIPLCDITERNGAVHLIPRSNRLMPSYRNASIPNIYDKYSERIRSYMQPVYPEAGEALIFDHSIIHYSPPNFSEKVRIAVNVFISNERATLRTCHLGYTPEGQRKIMIYQQQDDFIANYEQFEEDNTQLPKIGLHLEDVDYEHNEITPEKLYKEYGNPPAKNIFTFIKSKLGFND